MFQRVDGSASQEGPEPADAGWEAWRSQSIYRACLAFVTRQSRSPDQLAGLEASLAALDPRRPGPTCPGIQTLPLLVYAGVRGEDEPALPLAVALSLFTRGIDILDDLADGDRPADWPDYTAEEMHLVAAELLTALPQLALAELVASASTIMSMQQTLASGFLRACAGQQRDLALSGTSDPLPAEVEECAGAKSGALVGMQARLAAQFAGADAALVGHYEEFGQALGTALSIASDCLDLFAPGYSRDLRAGARTLPIAIFLQGLSEEERSASLRLLDAARRDDSAHETVRQQLREAGVLRSCIFIVAVYAQQARRALALASPREPAGRALSARIDAIPFLVPAGGSA